MKKSLRVALIACGVAKLDHAAPAAELYQSPLFRYAVGYAEATCDSWLILSAKHGLVAPETALEPYEQSLVGMALSARRAWARRVFDQLQPIPPHIQFVILAGAAYAAELVPLLDGCTANPAELPLAGLRQGEILAFYKKAGHPMSPAKQQQSLLAD